ncbi:MAG: hypothetical protein AAGC72_09330 [Planctomycetota bacterium]
MAKQRKRREPQLCYTEARGIGWYSTYRDPETNTPRKKQFGAISEEEARRAYCIWLVVHMDGIKILPDPQKQTKLVDPPPKSEDTKIGSLLLIGSSLIEYEERRTRAPGEARRSGTITPGVSKIAKSTSTPSWPS